MTSKIVTDRLIVSRYTKALFGLAREEECLDAVWNDFLLVEMVLDESPKSRVVVENPFISKDVQLQFLQVVKNNSNVSEVSTRFFELLVKNRRLYLLRAIKDSLLKYLQEFNNELAVTIISASDLEKVQITEISNILEKKFGKKIVCSSKVDENLLGGVVVKIGSKMIDCSLSSQLDKIASGSRNGLLNLGVSAK